MLRALNDAFRMYKNAVPNPGYKTVLDIFFKFNTPYLIKTFPVLYCVLARPAFINSSATQSQGAAIFPQK